ncbi:MAG: prolyl-tRNA synthetase associated domain-containing protein [Proteobacteria bacterium]|nr:prolyl-tRNA synthetase associated domain-containing protein [Pseudomonadota bacterium]
MENRIADTAPVTEAGLFARLEALGVAYTLHRHPPAFTLPEAQALRGTLPGGHVKNLFLRDKKKNIWLVTVLEERPVNLKALRHALAARGNLSFGSPELLMEKLGLTPGSVTPFGIINDRDGAVSVILDKDVLAQDPVNAHPLRNDMTIALAPAGLMRFLAAEGHEPSVIDFGALAVSSE